MTRQDVERDYKIHCGIIKSPGKFEGEPVWAPHLWEAVLAGDCYRDGHDGYIVPILREDQQEFPELLPYVEVRMWEDDSGFVHARAS